MKKQLSVLAGSLLVAAGSQAAVTLDGNTLAIFSTAGQGAYIQQIAGSTGDLLASGTGFSVDVSAAAAALGGSIDSFAIVALASGTNTYNYTEFLYVDVGGGLVSAGAPAPTTNLAAQNKIGAIQAFLDFANLGLNGEGSLGDIDGFATVADLLNVGGAAQIVLNAQTLGGATNSQAIEIQAPLLVEGTGNAALVGTQLVVAAPVPVPAAAWLFGSALLGLGVVRRKK